MVLSERSRISSVCNWIVVGDIGGFLEEIALKLLDL